MSGMENSTGACGRTVLVIDDERLNRKLIRTFLGMEGMEVIEAGDAESGLALARSRHPDLILLDVRLPGMSGLEAIRILKADEATREVPVVILSAGSLAEDDDHFRTAGAAGLVLKPFSRNELVEAVRAAIG
jgi:CheY-like chemotaxis protein